MLSWQASLGKTAGFLSLLGFIPYLAAIMQGRTKPNRATWWIWTIVGVMLSTSYHSSGASHTIYTTISYVIGPFIIAIFSLKYGQGGWNRFDRACIFSVGVSLLFWMLLKSPFTALLINILIDFLGTLPTFKKLYCDHEHEDPIAWVFFLIANMLNIFAIEHWSFTISFYPLYLFAISSTMVVLILRPKY